MQFETSLEAFPSPEDLRRSRDVLGRPVRRFATDQMAAVAGQDRTLALTVPAVRTEPERLLGAAPEMDGFLWDPGDASTGAAVGTVYRLRPRGSRRFRQLLAAADEVWRRLVVAQAPGCLGPMPVLVGGLAFDAGAADGAPWSGLGDGCFVLPRFLYRPRGHRATLSLNVRGDEVATADARAGWLARLEAMLRALGHDGPGEPSAPAVTAVHPPSRERWRTAVETIRRAIADRRFEKIVAAGRTRVELAEPLDVVSVLGRLARQQPWPGQGGADRSATTRFAVRHDGTTFLGATPERLIARRGRHIATEALAGSAARGSGLDEALASSAKDLHEHRLVVDAIVERLAPFCSRLDTPRRPAIRRLRHVAHLATPIRGTLRASSDEPPAHILELAEALHPTPAVGGLPDAEARRWIASHEEHPRGWYAAPIGWFDAAGNGELAVALRCALLHGRTADLFAGAGIVAESDPDREYEEIELKRRTLLRALT